MSLAVYTDVNWNGLKVVAEAVPEELDQKGRILAALGLRGDRLPQVDDENLARYYEYLAGNLSLPFQAHYPEPATPFEEAAFSCTVLELLDPTKVLSDEFSGIFCKTRKDRFEVNLPLVELEVSQDDPNFQLIEDYWYWFWNWR